MLPEHERLPLHGIRVIDFGTFLAGPMVGRILADNGAQVVRVKLPGGNTWSEGEGALAVLNLGKECVEIDLESDGGREQAWSLLKDADVVIENQPTQFMETFGIGPEAVHAHNPRCVYLRMPAFASGDEQYAELNAFDQQYLEGIMMACTGVFNGMGLNRQLMGVDPSFSSLPLASAYSSVYGALSVMLGLLDREASGVGDVFEVPVASCLAETLVYNSMAFNLPLRYLNIRELEIARRTANDIPMDLSYWTVKKMLDPFYHTYICQDGRPFYIVIPSHAIHQERCLRALGLWEECKYMFSFGDRYTDVDEWGDDVTHLFGTYPISDPVLVDDLKNRLAEAFRSRPADEWDRIFHGMSIPGCKVLTTKEYLNDKHTLAAGIIQERSVPSLGVTMRVNGPLVWLGRSSVPSSEDQRRTARARQLDLGGKAKRWLAGLNVVDLSNVIAGPNIGGMLARFGANVIKVDPVEPTYDPIITIFMGLPVSNGKQSLLADIKALKGRQILERLVGWADVVLVNQTEQQLTSLGVDEASLKVINPSVILTHFDCFGGPRWGPRSDGIGYDDLIQAFSGIMMRFGGVATPEEHAHLGTIDVISGVSGALSTCMSLLKLRRTGQADVARTSLAANGTHLQLPFMYDYHGREEFNEPSGRDALGWHALHRWYCARDGTYVFIAAAPPNRGLSADAAALERVGKALGGFQALADASNEGDRIAVITRLFAAMDAVPAVQSLMNLGVPAVAERRMSDLREQNMSDVQSFTLDSKHPIKTFNFFQQIDHPSEETVTMFAPCSIRSSRFAVDVLSPLPKYGQHTMKIMMKDLGFTEMEVHELTKAGAISHSWSKCYLPKGDPWKKTEKARLALVEEWTRLFTSTDAHTPEPTPVRLPRLGPWTLSPQIPSSQVRSISQARQVPLSAQQHSNLPMQPAVQSWSFARKGGSANRLIRSFRHLFKKL